MAENGSLTREFRIQRRIGVISAAACFGVVALNLSLRTAFPRSPIRDTLVHPNVWLFVLLGVLAYTAGRINKNGFRVGQVLLFLAYGFFAIVWNSSQDMTGQVFVVVGVLLASQYNLLRDRFLTKLVLIFSLVLVAGIVSVAIKQEMGIYNAIGNLVGSIGLLLVFWAIFSEDIRELIAENRQLLNNAESNRSFVEVGQNVTGLVHNFKAITQGLENYSYLLEKTSQDTGHEKLIEYSRKIREGIGSLTRRIDNILMAVRARSEVQAREIDVNRLIESIVELFNTIREFKQNLTVKMDFPEPVSLRCNPNECSQMFENVLRNAWEATIERRKIEQSYYPELFVTTAIEDGFVKVTFRDNGIGMKECDGCTREDCLDCPQWKLGRTTKEGGTGFGMVYITGKLKETGGKLRVRSKYREGTEMTLFLRT